MGPQGSLGYTKGSPCINFKQKPWKRFMVWEVCPPLQPHEDREAMRIDPPSWVWKAHLFVVLGPRTGTS
jgi:hypothetical protein